MSLAISAETQRIVANFRELAGNNQTVESLRTSLASGDHGFRLVPRILQELLEENQWMDRMDANNVRHTFLPHQFVNFITDPEPRGMATTMDAVRRYLGGSDNPLRVLFEQAAARKPGGQPENTNSLKIVHPETNNDNVTIRSEPTPPPVIPHASTGNSVDYAIRRLSRDRPDLLALVSSGELTAHGAMVRAGFAEKSVTVPTDPEKAARRLARHFRGESMRRLINALESTLYDDSLDVEE